MKKLAILAFIIAALAVPTAASADNGYGSVAGVSGSSGGSTPSSGSPSAVAATEGQAVTVGDGSAATLPFTGLEAGLMLGVGVLLVGGGLALRRFRPRDANQA